MDLGLRGAKVLVMAASKGLGAATARRFSLEGALVCINSRDLGQLQETASRINGETGNIVYTMAGDVTDAGLAQRVVTNAAETLGGLDVLVTNAGGPPPGAFTDFELADWEAATRLTLLSHVQVIRAALPYLRESTRAAILTIASVSAKEPANNLTFSNTIRPSVVGLTNTLSREVAPDGIRVNSILPGITDTERIAELHTARAERNQSTIEDELQISAASIPLGRIGKPDEFANAAVFLCSPAASFITGVALPVDGGMLQGIL
jgi:3-oxoacyl-[acyl-carrier protein] reductase